MDSQAFTLFHTAISLVAILTGFIAFNGLFRSATMPTLSAIFLGTTAATSITGYFFHREQILPSHIVGAVALVVLAVTLWARYGQGFRGRWRAVYAWGVVLSLWFNVFVLIVQSFLKIAPLHALAPKGSEPPFAIAQLVVLVLFAVFGWRAAKRFSPVAR